MDTQAVAWRVSIPVQSSTSTGTTHQLKWTSKDPYCSEALPAFLLAPKTFPMMKLQIYQPVPVPSTCYLMLVPTYCTSGHQMTCPVPEPFERH